LNLIEELTWRGMFHDAMPGTADHLASHAPITGYIGFDPTASLAAHRQPGHHHAAGAPAAGGHRPVALVGGATGMIGDPSGKSAERNLLDEITLRRNQDGIRAQLESFSTSPKVPPGLWWSIITTGSRTSASCSFCAKLASI
jgi:tyrosyl-tRNA synthetase